MMDWDGEERRSLPIHLLKFVEERIINHTTEMRKTLSDHTDDEMDRFDQIVNKINVNDAKSESRHDETQSRLNHLSQSIENFLAEQELFHAAIKRAFPKDEEGHPDYDGHRGAHLAWMSDAKESKEFKNYVKKVVMAAVGIATVSWLWAVILPALLQHGH